MPPETAAYPLAYALRGPSGEASPRPPWFPQHPRL